MKKRFVVTALGLLDPDGGVHRRLDPDGLVRRGRPSQ